MIVDVNILIEATAFKLCDVSADSSSIFFHIKSSNICLFKKMMNYESFAWLKIDKVLIIEY